MEAEASVSQIKITKTLNPFALSAQGLEGLGWVVFTPSGFTQAFPGYPLPMGKAAAVVRFSDRTIGLFKANPEGGWGIFSMGDPVPGRGWHRPLKGVTAEAAFRAEALLLMGEPPCGELESPQLLVSFPGDQVPSFERIAGGALGTAPLDLLKGDPGDSPEDTYAHLCAVGVAGTRVLLPKSIVPPDIRGTRHLYHSFDGVVQMASTHSGSERGHLSKVQIVLAADLKSLGFSKK